MFRRIAVGDIMTRNFAAIKPSNNLQQCARDMVKKRVNSILITERKKLLGILTARDILWAMTKKPNINLKDVKVMDIATRKVAVIKPSADIVQALNKMKKYSFRKLPVLLKGEVVGMLTIKDILRVDPSIYAEIGGLSGVREETKKLRKLAKVEEDEYDSEGPCEECDSFAPLLRVEGRLLCPDCRDELF